MSPKDDEQNNVALRRRNHERKNKIDVKITYFNKREIGKWVRKSTLNHSSLVDEEEETKVLVTANNKLSVVKTSPLKMVQDHLLTF